jgi:16S rRNA A1518/A1519 N6-dimethyltransferase RsmA/KsgA/DIM1 with predicted DNA glycosylase/AP lyase activity
MNYKNIIGISNLPDSITSDIIYFSIDTKTAANDCIIQMPCQFAYIPAKPTSKMYCVFSISESKCENYEN